MTSGGASVPSVCGKTPADEKNKLPDPLKVIKVLSDADLTSGEKKPPAYEDQASFSWTHRYPAKLKAVLWNFTQNSAKLVTASPRRPPVLPPSSSPPPPASSSLPFFSRLTSSTCERRVSRCSVCPAVCVPISLLLLLLVFSFAYATSCWQRVERLIFFHS